MDRHYHAYRAELDTVLLNGSPKKLCRFMRKHRLPIPSTLAAAEITLHKTITAARTLPTPYRRTSRDWLLERGYTSWDDGDLG